MTLRYLFCVVAADDRVDLAAWHGDAAPLAKVTVDGIAGVVGSVDEGHYGEAPLARAMRDVGAVAPYAEAHHAVVQYVFERASAVVPIAFGSLHASDADVRAALRDERIRLLMLLQRFRGAQEWGLRLAKQRARVAVAAGEPGAGTAYLASRRAELRGALDIEARRAAEALDAEITDLCTARRALAESTGDLVLRCAYLLPARRAEEVKRLVLERGADLERVGLAAELSGPWPPYSFVEDSEERGA